MEVHGDVGVMYGINMVRIADEEEVEEEAMMILGKKREERNKKEEMRLRVADLPLPSKIRTMYKRKKDKVRPVDQPHKDGGVPEEKQEWKEPLEGGKLVDRSYYNGNLIPKFSKIKKGSRLTEERVSELKIGGDLTKREKELLLEVLFNREEAIAFDFNEKGIIKREVEAPHKIPTIEHQAWQAAGFRVPKGLREEVREIIEDRLKAGTAERSWGPYRNPWFLVPKKNKKHRLIIAAQRINAVTIRDASLPPSADEFSEDFTGYPVVSLLDFFSGYDQVSLHPESRDLTAFQTELGLMRLTTVPQGYTNGVQLFDRVIRKILREVIRTGRGAPFVDDVAVKAPNREWYQLKDGYYEEALPGVRRFVWEAILSLDMTLTYVELAGASISGLKSEFLMSELKIVAFMCGKDGRKPDPIKIDKITKWGPCRDLTDARAFIGLCVYYRVWIKDFAKIAAPIYALNKKGVEFEWGDEQQKAMDTLKGALTSAPLLKPIDYKSKGRIILSVDASRTGWGAILQQEEESSGEDATLKGKRKRHPARYEGGCWAGSELNYDAGKLECRGLMKALKKFREYLYGTKFLVEIDARTLVYQLNLPASDLPGSVVNRWLAWIRLFDFDIEHVEGKKHGGPDGLSRRGKHSEDSEESDVEEMERMMDADLMSVRVADLPLVSEKFGSHGWVAQSFAINVNQFPQPYRDIAEYLTTLTVPGNIPVQERRRFIRKATQFLLQNGILWRRAKTDEPPKRVIFNDLEKAEIIRAMHDEGGHRGREGTYKKIMLRYWWVGMYHDVRKFVQSCEPCQKRSAVKPNEPLHPTLFSSLWRKVGLDVIHMPKDEGFGYLAVMRDDLSGWPEAEPMRKNDSRTISNFVRKWIHRFGIPGRVVYDGGAENQKETKEVLESFNIIAVPIATYHPQSNGMVERGHKQLVDALAKLGKQWRRNLDAVLWADRVTTRKSTGFSPFRLIYGEDCVLPVELSAQTWAVIDWNRVNSIEKLLAARARLLQRRDEDIKKAQEAVRASREKNKAWFDKNKPIRKDKLVVGDWVLVHNTQLEKQWSKKLDNRWLGPYKIRSVSDKGTYLLQEPDGTHLTSVFAGERVKRFYPRQGILDWEEFFPNED